MNQLRLALRVEGSMWNAYMAETDSMVNAKLIASVSIAAAKADLNIKETFFEMAKKVFEFALAEAGLTNEGWEEPVVAPAHERGGNA